MNERGALFLGFVVSVVFVALIASLSLLRENEKLSSDLLEGAEDSVAEIVSLGILKGFGSNYDGLRKKLSTIKEGIEREREKFFWYQDYALHNKRLNDIIKDTESAQKIFENEPLPYHRDASRFRPPRP